MIDRVVFMKCEYIHLIRNGYIYVDKYASNLEMYYLSNLLTSNVACSSIESYLELAYDAEFHGGCGNSIWLEKEDGYMSLTDGIPDPDEPPQEPIWLKIPLPKYVKLLENWRDQVCKLRPAEVIIRYENEQFIFETKK